MVSSRLVILTHCPILNPVCLAKWPSHLLLEKVNEPQSFWVLYILMYVDPWQSVLEVNTGISLSSQMTFRGMVMSFLWEINLNHLKCSNDAIMRWKNKLIRVLKPFNQIEVVNTYSMSLWHILRRMWFSLNGLLQEHHSCMVCPKGGIEPGWIWFDPWWSFCNSAIISLGICTWDGLSLVSSKSKVSNPYEIWTGHKHSISHLQV